MAKNTALLSTREGLKKKKHPVVIKPLKEVLFSQYPGTHMVCVPACARAQVGWDAHVHK